MYEFGYRKVVIIGAGRVGSHAALAILSGQLTDEIVLIDVNSDAAQAEMYDLKDWATALDLHVKIRVGSFADCADAGFVVMTAGRHRRAGESRLEMLDGTFAILADIVGPLRESGFHGILISVSNPADVVAEYLYRNLDLPREHCFGTGTALDTMRLRRTVGTLVGLERSQVQAVVMGEHGDSAFVPTSHVFLGGTPLTEYLRIHPEHAEVLSFGHVMQVVRGTGAGIIGGKGATEFGIGATVAMVIAAVLHNDKRVIPLSAHLEGEYGENHVSVGVPCKVGRDGIEGIDVIELTDNELVALHRSCDIIRTSLDGASV